MTKTAVLDNRPATSSNAGSVVITDDNEAIRSLLRLVLEEAGYQVVSEAERGAAALIKVALYDPDIVVLDEHMPPTSLLHAARLIRAAAPEIGIVICSGSVVGEQSAVDAVVPKEDAAYPPLALHRIGR